MGKEHVRMDDSYAEINRVAVDRLFEHCHEHLERANENGLMPVLPEFCKRGGDPEANRNFCIGAASATAAAMFAVEKAFGTEAAMMVADIMSRTEVNLGGKE